MCSVVLHRQYKHQHMHILGLCQRCAGRPSLIYSLGLLNIFVVLCSSTCILFRFHLMDKVCLNWRSPISVASQHSLLAICARSSLITCFDTQCSFLLTWIKMNRQTLCLTLPLHLFQFVALQLSRQAKEVEIYFRKSSRNGSFVKEETGTDEAKADRLDGLERLKEEKSLAELYPSLASGVGDLVILSPK